MRKELSFYFDYISHNAYLAWKQLPRLADAYELKVKPVPVLFAGFLNQYGQLGPAEIPPKVRWMTKDVIRKAKLLDLPFAPPASHPFNPLLPLRVSSLPLEEDDRYQLIDALFDATWSRSLDVSLADVVISTCDDIGLSGNDLVRQAATQVVKRTLAERTRSAIEAGVFGVPTFVVDQELFWGFDDIPHLELFLKGEDPLNDQEFSKWLDVKPSSQRKLP